MSVCRECCVLSGRGLQRADSSSRGVLQRARERERERDLEPFNSEAACARVGLWRCRTKCFTLTHCSDYLHGRLNSFVEW
jgi:hypothetical protein